MKETIPAAAHKVTLQHSHPMGNLPTGVAFHMYVPQEPKLYLL